MKPNSKWCLRCKRHVYGSDEHGDPYEFCPVCATTLVVPGHPSRPDPGVEETLGGRRG